MTLDQFQNGTQPERPPPGLETTEKPDQFFSSLEMDLEKIKLVEEKVRVGDEVKTRQTSQLNRDLALKEIEVTKLRREKEELAKENQRLEVKVNEKTEKIKKLIEILGQAETKEKVEIIAENVKLKKVRIKISIMSSTRW